MTDAHRSLREWLHARRPTGVPGVVALVFVLGGLLAGGAGGVASTLTPLGPEEAPIVDPIASRSCTWASHLAANDSGLSHSSNGGGFGWWGENVAAGYGSASAVVNG